VEFRYPGDLPSVSRNEGKKAMRLGEKTRDLILASLKPLSMLEDRKDELHEI
jgi:hypothetical protein